MEYRITESGTELQNPGTVSSEPILRIYGSGVVDLLVNDQMLEVVIRSGESHITLNTELKEAYCSRNSRNSNMTGEFPLLEPGRNTISWSGDVDHIVITPNWRFL